MGTEWLQFAGERRREEDRKRCLLCSEHSDQGNTSWFWIIPYLRIGPLGQKAHEFGCNKELVSFPFFQWTKDVEVYKS